MAKDMECGKVVNERSITHRDRYACHGGGIGMEVDVIVRLRWWLFHRLSELGWWVCPEPHKSNLQSIMPQWKDYAE